MVMKLAGVVLAGGLSRRFGRDKALEPLGGQPLIHWSVGAIRNGADVLAVNGPKRLGEILDLPTVTDFPGAQPGPLAGILAALAWGGLQTCSHVLTAPCDTPFLPADLATRLAGAIGERAVVAARAARVHALCALWRVDVLDQLAPIARRIDQPSLQQIIEGLGGRFVDFADEASFANLNTQEDLNAARQRWRA